MKERLPEDPREHTWMVPNWPVEYGGVAWTPMRCYIFEEEVEAAYGPHPL